MNDKQYTQEMIKNLNTRLKTKQEALKFDSTPTEGSVNPVTSEGVKAYADASKGTTYTAGENIAISANNVISAIDTKYTAGDNIKISENNVISSTTDVSGTDDGMYWDSLTIDGKSKLFLQGCVIEGEERSEGFSDNLIPKVWAGFTEFNGEYIWTDGESIYYSSGSDQYILDKSTSTWTPKTWTGLTDFYGDRVWTDGENIYYSFNFDQYVLDKATSTWTEKTWTGLTSFSGSRVWTDGENIYCSGNTNQYVLNKTTSTWTEKTWTGLTSFNGERVWTDGENIYYSYWSSQYVLNKTTSVWTQKTWTGLTEFSGERVWTDGENIYYSSGSQQFQIEHPFKTVTTLAKVAKTGDYSDLKNKIIVNPTLEGDEEKLTGLEVENVKYRVPEVKILDGFSSEWTPKTWTGLTNFNGDFVWIDGENIYYSSDREHYVLNKTTSTWTQKTWTGLTSFYGTLVWVDGEHIYYSNSSNQYVLDKSTSTWSPKTWTGLTNFYGNNVWTDGESIYYSSNAAQYVLDKTTSTWSQKTWTGLTSFDGNYIWVDGENFYYSDNSQQYVLDKATSTWTEKTWTGLTSFYGTGVWTDGDNTYYSNSSNQYVLDKSTSTWSPKTWTGLTSFYSYGVWTDGENIYYSFDDSADSQFQLNLNYKAADVLAKVAETGSYDDLTVKPAIPNEEHLYIYSIEVDNGTDTITLTNIQTSELLQSTLIFDDLINLIQIGSSGVGDGYTTLQGSLGFVSQKSDTQFTLLTEDGSSHSFASTDTLTITSHLEKTIF